jgi:broad specificity phosphatase PhoE
MKIGLVRHFKVDIKKSRYMTASDYDKYSSNYDIADVIPNEIVIDKEWDKCYCSSLPRALKTARTIYHGDITPTDNLREIPSVAIFKLRFHLPYNLWAILNRIAWVRNHTAHPEGRTKTLKRINEIMETIFMQDEENILIVSHAGTMYEIQKILRRKGFRGRGFIKAKNGKLYVYEKK